MFQIYFSILYTNVKSLYSDQLEPSIPIKIFININFVNYRQNTLFKNLYIAMSKPFIKNQF